MSTSDPRTVFEQFLAAVNGRDVGALDDLLHPDFEEVYPQSGEVTRGVQNLKAIIENYPGAYEDLGPERVVGGQDRWVTTPLFTLVRVEGSGTIFTGVQKARYSDGSEWHVIQIAQLKDGRIWRLHTYFAPAFEAPAWRSAFVEPQQGS